MVKLAGNRGPLDPPPERSAPTAGTGGGSTPSPYSRQEAMAC